MIALISDTQGSNSCKTNKRVEKGELKKGTTTTVVVEVCFDRE